MHSRSNRWNQIEMVDIWVLFNHLFSHFIVRLPCHINFIIQLTPFVHVV